MTDQAPSWIAEPFGNPLDVNLSVEGAQWQHHLSTALSDLISYGSFAGSRRVMVLPGGESFEYVEYEARDSGLRSKLWVVVNNRSVLIAGDGPEDDAQVTPWVQAVGTAKARMAEQHPVFRWARARRSHSKRSVPRNGTYGTGNGGTAGTAAWRSPACGVCSALDAFAQWGNHLPVLARDRGGHSERLQLVARTRGCDARLESAVRADDGELRSGMDSPPESRNG
jgi:hypothetical protein